MIDDARTGLALLIAHLTTLSAVLALLLVHVAMGRAVRERFDIRVPVRGTWRWPVDAALGAGVLASLLFVAALVGALAKWAVLAITAACALAARRELTRVMSEVAAVVITRPDAAAFGETGERAWVLPRALLVVVLLLLLAAALAPPTEWDSLMYHLRIPLWLLEQGRWAVPPDSFHVALVGLWHLATLPLLALGIQNGPAVMQVVALVLTVAATTEVARYAGAGRTGRAIAIAVLLGCPAFALVAITARVDVALVLLLVAGHLALAEAADGSRSGAGGSSVAAHARLLLLGAVLIGFALAIKPQAGAYALALVPLGWRAAAGWRRATIAAVAAGAVSAPWFLKNQLLVGAPLYPKGAPGWFEPWLAAIFDTKARPATLDASVLDALPESREAFDLLDAFLDPGALTIEGEGAFYALSPALLLLPLAAVAWRSRRAMGPVLLVGIAYALLVVVPFGRINLRYLMPAVPPLAAALAVTAEWMVSRASPAMRRIALVSVAVLAILPLSGALRQRLLDPHVVLLRHAIGIASREEVWFRHPDGTARGFAPAVANVRLRVPPGGKVLMLWEARALPLERETIADVMLSNWSFLAQSPAVADCLAGTGITHLLVGTGSVEYYVSRGADPRAFRLGEFAGFRDRCLTGHRVIGPGFDLFEVRRRSP
jgi:hypothetical protein